MCPVDTLGRLAYRYDDVIADGRADALGAVLAVAWRMAGGGFEPFQGAISRAAFHPLRMTATIRIDDIFLRLHAARRYSVEFVGE
jgi:hypothetical protein